MAATAEKTKAKPKVEGPLADVTGYYVSGDRGIMCRDGSIHGEYTKLTPEMGITQEQFDMLLKAGYIRKGIGKSPKSIFTADTRPEIRENLDRVAEGQKAKRKAKVWNFSDDQLRGKDIDELNLLIVERGGEPQETEEEAILLLQSELE